MVEYPIDEFAIIFNRVLKDDDDTEIEEFVPVNVVEGYYYPDEECFIDANQNVYSHMASLADVGNVYAGRRTIIDLLKNNEHASISSIKEKILNRAQRYNYYKNTEPSSNEFNKIKVKDKETGEIKLLNDKDTKYFYEQIEDAKELLLAANNKVDTQENINTKEEVVREKESVLTPNEIINEVKKTIKGQDEAIEKITTVLWVKNNFPMIKKTNMLVVGPPGVGKTAIFRKLREILDIPVTIYGITGNSQAGYKGHDVEEMLVHLYNESGEDIERAQNGLIIIDEFDKLNDNRDTGEVGTIAVQNELLKIIEGCDRMIEVGNHKTVNIDTSNIVFVGCGAFADLFKKKEKKNTIGFGEIVNSEEEKIVVDTDMIVKKGGIIPELARRLPVVVQLNSLTKENLKDILLNSEDSYFRQVILSIESSGIEIENLDLIVDTLIDDAMKKNLGGDIGASVLDSVVMNTFLKIFNEIGNNPGMYSKVIIGSNIVNDNCDYQLIPKNVKTKTLTEKL